jgi:copper chaperone CopZ
MNMVLKVQGMSCGHCVAAITAAVTPLPGVTGVEVDLAAQEVRVDGNPDTAAVTAAIEDAGYDVAASSERAESQVGTRRVARRHVRSRVNRGLSSTP